jgi:hypothetical protein
MNSYSPLLAAATAFFELLAAGIALLGPGRKRILYPIGLTFFILAGYQIAEISVCARPENLFFSRIAFFDITWLPPLGLYLAYQIAFPKLKWLKTVFMAYLAAGLVLVSWIFIDPNCITQSVCDVVVARYFPSSPFDICFGTFYQSGLMILVFSSAYGLVKPVDKINRKHLANLLIGTLGFILPSIALRFMLPEPDGLLPSVMCHFALILALSLYVLVRREQRAEKSGLFVSDRHGLSQP